MRDDVILIIVGATISTLLLLIFMLLLASIIRRAFNERKYRTLDALRDRYGKTILAAIEAGELDRAVRECVAAPESKEWQAVENVLLRLVNKKRYAEDTKKLLTRLGYISHYERQLANKNVHVLSLSIDKLGRMKSNASVPLLTGLLDAKDPEIVSVTVRSLSKISGPLPLQALGPRLQTLLNGSVVAGKTIHTALLAFGADVIPYLLDVGEGQSNPREISSRLDILSRLPAAAGSADLAIRHLSSDNAEVRSKALKVLGRAENIQFASNLPGLIVPLLEDPVWYVRLQAIRSASALKCVEAACPTGKLIHDRNWQVRNEAAQAVILLGEYSLDVILEVLSGTDRYAKDSVCEEIEKTGLSARLIENLKGDDADLREKSHQVLEIMRSLGFSATLETYLRNGDAEKENDRSRELLGRGTPA